MCNQVVRSFAYIPCILVFALFVFLLCFESQASENRKDGFEGLSNGIEHEDKWLARSNSSNKEKLQDDWDIKRFKYRRNNSLEALHKGSWGKCDCSIKCAGKHPKKLLFPRPTMRQSWVQGSYNVDNHLFRKCSSTGKRYGLNANKISDWLIFNGKLVIADDMGVVSLYDIADLAKPIWSVSFSKFKIVSQFIKIAYDEANNLIVVGMGSSSLYALNADNSKIMWHKDLRSPLHERVVVQSGVLFFSTVDNYLHVVDAKKGKIKWGYQANLSFVRASNDHAISVIDGKVLFVGQVGDVYALGVESGKLDWTTNLGEMSRSENFNGLPAPLAYTQDKLILSFCNGLSYALDLKTGKKLWEMEVNHMGGSIVDLRVIKGQVFFVYSSGMVEVFGLGDGKFVWAFDSSELYSDSVVMGAIIFDSLFWLVGDDGYFLGFDLSSGRCVRRWNPAGDVFILPMIAFEKMYLYNGSSIVVVG